MVNQSKLYDDIWLIGGAQVYNEALSRNLVNEVYATVINEDFKCDTFFPDLSDDFSIVDKSEIYNENNINFNYIPSATNFITLEFKTKEIASDLCNSLLKRGVILRHLISFGLPNCVRITVGLPEENDFLIKNIKELI